MQRITSKSNEHIKHLKKLYQKKFREEFSEYVIEGIKIVKEAIAEGQIIKSVYVNEDSKEEIISAIPEITKMDLVIVEKNVFQDISGVTNPQGIIAIVKKNEDNRISYEEDFYLILDGISDPGNLGTIIRTADSLGIKQIIVSNNTVEVFNPKVVRSTMGAIFRVKIIEVESIVDIIAKMKERKIRVYATDLDTDKTIYSVSYEKAAVIIGNEANGVEDTVKKVASEKIKIPMLGKTESLNAAVATSIILYEAYRNKLK